MKCLSKNCKNCGAPVRGRGYVKCQYCSTEYFIGDEARDMAFGSFSNTSCSPCSWQTNVYMSSYPQNHFTNNGKFAKEPKYREEEKRRDDFYYMPDTPYFGD